MTSASTHTPNELGVEVEIFHSNIEGEVVNKIYEAHDSGDVSAALFNPAAYSSGHPGIIAAIAQVDYPFYEIHISNPYSRGGQSQVAGVSKGVITGFGLVRLLPRHEGRSGFPVTQQGLFIFLKTHPSTG